MIDLAILKAFGSTQQRLKEVFTAVATDETKPARENADQAAARKKRIRQRSTDIDNRNKLERVIQSRVEEGLSNSLRNWRIYSAVDLAWDSSIIVRDALPLLLYAQGKIDVGRAADMLATCKNGENYIERDAKGNATSIDLGGFLQAEFNLVRSVIGRRHAAQVNKYNNLWPFYHYESRTTSVVGRFRADAMSQRADIMADQFGIRHHDGQVVRDAMLYAHSVDFPRCCWEVEKQWRKKTALSDPTDVETYVVKEGISWHNPHPTRIFHDTAYPLTSLNSDTGCDYVGFWDVVRYRDVDNNPDYFNKNIISFNSKFWGPGGLTTTYLDYFNQYNFTIKPPVNSPIDLAKSNDRLSNVGFYSGDYGDTSVFVTNYYQKIVPKDYGIGDYPFPVWVRLVLANYTVIFAEFIPSRPCAVLSINESDTRLVNVSMAMDVLQYQQHMTNLLMHLMYLLQIEAFKAIGVNSDGLEKKDVEAVLKMLRAENWYAKPIVYPYSLVKKLEALGNATGKAVEDIISISEAKTGQSIQSVLDAMFKLLGFVERLIAMSPNEQGQPAPREISATEVTEIASTTSSVYSAISDCIDEFREAKKIIIYESTVCCSTADVNLPIKGRYTTETIKKAGFTIPVGEDLDVSVRPKQHTVIGSAKALVHEYIFSGRDGSERPVNTQAANTLTQLVGYVMSVPAVAQKIGKAKIYEIFNEIFRQSGAGIDLNLEMAEGEDDTLGEDEMQMLKSTVEQLTQYMQQLAMQVQGNSTELQKQGQVNADQESAIEMLTKLADQVRKNALSIKKIEEKHDEMNNRLAETIDYKEAPDTIKAQLEQRAGFVPATSAQRAASREKAAPKK